MSMSCQHAGGGITVINMPRLQRTELEDRSVVEPLGKAFEKAKLSTILKVAQLVERPAQEVGGSSPPLRAKNEASCNMRTATMEYQADDPPSDGWPLLCRCSWLYNNLLHCW